MLSLLLPVLNLSFVKQTILLFARCIYISTRFISNFSYVYRLNRLYFIFFVCLSFPYSQSTTVVHFVLIMRSSIHSCFYSFQLRFLSFFYFQIAFFSPVFLFFICKSPFYSSLFYHLFIFHYFILYSIFIFFFFI